MHEMTLSKKMTIRRLIEWHRELGKAISASGIHKNLANYGIKCTAGKVDGIAYTSEYLRRKQEKEAAQAPMETPKDAGAAPDIALLVATGKMTGNKKCKDHLECVKIALQIQEAKRDLVPMSEHLAALAEHADIVKGAFADWQAAVMASGATAELVIKHKKICAKVVAAIRKKFEGKE
jgi:hypothetical protein